MSSSIHYVLGKLVVKQWKDPDKISNDVIGFKSGERQMAGCNQDAAI